MRTLLGLVILSLAAGADLEEDAAAIRPTAAESSWRLVPMLSSMKVALKRARAQNKPIYYFGADGILDSGNC